MDYPEVQSTVILSEKGQINRLPYGKDSID